MSIPRITPKEWTQYVEQQMVINGFSPMERKVVRAAFEQDMVNEDWHEYAERVGSFFNTGEVKPGITQDELRNTMAELRDKNSALSKGLKINLDKHKLERLEDIMEEAEEGNKEGFF